MIGSSSYAPTAAEASSSLRGATASLTLAGGAAVIRRRRLSRDAPSARPLVRPARGDEISRELWRLAP
jgi:hypothetical protein